MPTEVGERVARDAEANGITLGMNLRDEVVHHRSDIFLGIGVPVQGNVGEVNLRAPRVLECGMQYLMRNRSSVQLGQTKIHDAATIRARLQLGPIRDEACSERRRKDLSVRARRMVHGLTREMNLYVVVEARLLGARKSAEFEGEGRNWCRVLHPSQ